MKCKLERKLKKEKETLPDDVKKFVNKWKNRVTYRRLATLTAEQFPEMKLCPGNQIEGMELVWRAEGIEFGI